MPSSLTSVGASERTCLRLQRLPDDVAAEEQINEEDASQGASAVGDGEKGAGILLVPERRECEREKERRWTTEGALAGCSAAQQWQGEGQADM